MTTARPELPADIVNAYTRQALLEGAIKAAAEHGVQGAGIAQIVKAARRARKTLYDNYSGKDEVLRAALRWLADGLFSAYSAGGGDAALAWAKAHPEGVTVLLRHGHVIDRAYMVELSELAAEALQLPLPVVGGGLFILQRAERDGDPLTVVPDLEAFATHYKDRRPHEDAADPHPRPGPDVRRLRDL